VLGGTTQLANTINTCNVVQQLIKFLSIQFSLREEWKLIDIRFCLNAPVTELVKALVQGSIV